MPLNIAMDKVIKNKISKNCSLSITVPPIDNIAMSNNDLNKKAYNSMTTLISLKRYQYYCRLLFQLIMYKVNALLLI